MPSTVRPRPHMDPPCARKQPTQAYTGMHNNTAPIARKRRRTSPHGRGRTPRGPNAPVGQSASATERAPRQRINKRQAEGASAQRESKKARRRPTTAKRPQGLFQSGHGPQPCSLPLPTHRCSQVPPATVHDARRRAATDLRSSAGNASRWAAKLARGKKVARMSPSRAPPTGLAFGAPESF